MSFYNLQLFLTSFFHLLLLFKQTSSKAIGEKLKKMENKIPLSLFNSWSDALRIITVHLTLKYTLFYCPGRVFQYKQNRKNEWKKDRKKEIMKERKGGRERGWKEGRKGERKERRKRQCEVSRVTQQSSSVIYIFIWWASLSYPTD